MVLNNNDLEEVRLDFTALNSNRSLKSPDKSSKIRVKLDQAGGPAKFVSMTPINTNKPIVGLSSHSPLRHEKNN